MEKIKSSGYAPVNGLNMYYEVYGSGSMPLVLVHGGGSTIGTSFGAVIALLSGHGKIIAPELEAHGRTSDRDGPASFEQDADDVVALLQYLKIGKADFLGFSNGGSTTMQVAIRHPQMVNKIVVASAFYKREGMIPGFFEGLRNATLADMPAPLKAAYLEVAPDRGHLPFMFEKDRARMLNFVDWKDEALRSIKAPTLLLVADRDVVTTEHTLNMSRLIPDARLTVLPGIHGSFMGEVCTAVKGSKLPEMTVTLVKEFLNGGW